MGFNQEVTNEHNALRESLIGFGFDPDLISEFLQKQLEENRATDNLYKDELGKNEFYQREKIYSQMEVFLLHLK